MRIEYICHACCLVETGDLKIVTDPWFAGPAFCEKWYVFPKPVRTDFVDQTDVVLISHGHEDHLHEATLRLFPKDARVFYPYSFFAGAKEYIQNIGFSNVTEAVTFKKYRLSDRTSVTFIINSHDSIMVIESDGKVLVNANDALHSSAEKVIDYFVSAIKARWPRIDTLLCGFGGASYFPNLIHIEGKDDREISLAREQLFAHTFCRIVRGIEPEVAIPFAADFCLLDPGQLWINEVRFPRSRIAEYYERCFSQPGYSPKIFDMYSGDVLENCKMQPASPYRDKMQAGRLFHLVAEQYGDEIARKSRTEAATEDEIERLVCDVRENIRQRMRLFEPDVLRGLRFALNITDVVERNFLNVALRRGHALVSRDERPDPDRVLTLELSSKLLRYSISSDWGADVITVGYGADVQIAHRSDAEVDLERVCMNLIARYPTHWDINKTPLRTLKFLLLNPPRFTTSIRRLKRFTLESENYDRKTWLLKSASEIRRCYNLPEIGEMFTPRER